MIVWALLFSALLGVVLLQDLPWLGIPQTWGRDPVVVANAVVVALAVLTVVMSVGRVVQELP